MHKCWISLNDKEVHGLKIKSVPRTFINTTNKNKGCMGTIQTCSFDKQTFNCTRRTIHNPGENFQHKSKKKGW